MEKLVDTRYPLYVNILEKDMFDLIDYGVSILGTDKTYNELNTFFNLVEMVV